MMNKITLGALLALGCVSLEATAQTKTLSIEDAMLNPQLAPANLRQLQWIKASDAFSYAAPFGKTEYLLKGTAASTHRDTLAKASALPNAPKRLPFFSWISEQKAWYAAGNDYYYYDVASQKATVFSTLPDDADNADVAENNQYIAYTRAQNLFVAIGTEQIQVTNEPNKAIVNGQAAHRNEFGITKGTFWSPKANLLAFYRLDQTMVTDYPLVNTTPIPAEANLIKYPMAGDKSHHATVGVFDLKKKTTVFLQTGEPAEQYLTNITWSPDEKSIYIAVLNRDQNHLKLNQYDVATGKFLKTLFEEKHDKYVEPEHELLFLPNNANQFIWQSDRDGFSHLYLYNTDGKQLKQLTKGNFEVTATLGFDAKGEKLFLQTTGNQGLDRHLASVTVSGKFAQLTQTSGTHNVSVSEKSNFVLDNFSNLSTPRRISVLASSGKEQSLLLEAANPLKDFTLGKIEFVTLQAQDGTPLNARLITPPNLEAGKKYKAVVYVYGGPHAQLVTNNWLGGANLWMHYMAQQGYVMFTIDNRGSEHRGRAFEQATFRQLGTAEMADQLAGLKYLKNLAFVDSSRVGVHGWSFGGFMTTSLMTRTPNAFKVGVAGGPVIDWRMYEIMYTERYMDTPATNEQGYKTNNLLEYVPNLKGKLMLIHGTDDDVVVWQHSLKYVQKAVETGKLIDYFVYPGHKHNVQGRDRLHLMRKITQYFEDYL
ncbi:dipeptidyl-peptidase-4 [Flexibacter flexilis DSM 6793]|uniref:Dipeptidyl-peptidase-4 n=1 Tax=Flexibacter flexilis DSM 6793 TaxID=927664 RepID=A0A1I1JS19_9BACT|nr:DPP IV N-terminal domain-containing protein [Flexibacter flexilis]SFC51021.1 dipeptidyl-peptidase-4 [Flexibacter flexilis DSM 6793]